MPDWSKTMQQTFEYYVVDPNTWRDKSKITNAIESKIERSSESNTLGSATIDTSESLGECYIRIYLVTIQNGITEKFPLGTFLVQTPNKSFDGGKQTISMDAYTPLLELSENQPPLGYSILKDTNIMESAYMIVRDNVRAPVVKGSNSEKLYDDFVANTDDTWLTFTSDLVAKAKNELGLDEMGRILFLPKQDLKSLQPVWTYDDNNSSILYPDINIKHDIYGIPNVVEVIYSNDSISMYGKAVNNDKNSPTSTINRGREIVYRVTDPDLGGQPTEAQITEYATNTLRELSSVEYSITYSHGYCPVRLGDCVRLNYTRAGIVDIKAKVTNQSITCTSGCKVTETAVFTTNLWG